MEMLIVMWKLASVHSSQPKYGVMELFSAYCLPWPQIFGKYGVAGLGLKTFVGWKINRD